MSLVCAALVLATLYMPWNWQYDWYRADQYFESRNYTQALKWYERADRIHPGDASLENNIQVTRALLGPEQESGQ